MDQLRGFKLSDFDFNYKAEPTFAELIEIDWESLRYVQADPDAPIPEEAKAPVQMTSLEIAMSHVVEELSDELTAELQDQQRSSMGKTQIAFFDISTMSTMSRLVVLVGVLAIFGAVGRFFYKELFDKEPNVNDVRKEMLKMRKEQKKSK